MVAEQIALVRELRGAECRCGHRKKERPDLLRSLLSPARQNPAIPALSAVGKRLRRSLRRRRLDSRSDCDKGRIRHFSHARRDNSRMWECYENIQDDDLTLDDPDLDDGVTDEDLWDDFDELDEEDEDEDDD